MLLSRCKLKIYSRRPGELLQPKHIELMGHVIFAWTVVLVGRIQSKVCDLTTVKARKSLDLCKHAKRKINPKKMQKMSLISTARDGNQHEHSVQDARRCLKACYLMSKSGVLITRLHELPPHFMELNYNKK